MPDWVPVLTVYLHYLLTTVTPVNPGCDCVVFQSYGLNDGRFTSPNFPENYPNTNCILYSFFGDSFEIIELTFLEFDLRGRTDNGSCQDYVRIFQNLERPEVNENSQWDAELCGNYSSLVSRKFYSSHRSLILEFHSQFPLNNKHRGFHGIYRFLDKKVAVRNFVNTGRRKEGQPCTYEFVSNSSERSKTGRFFSPFFPQAYKPNSTCSYFLRALPGERVRVLFSNIQLHHSDVRMDQASCLHAPDVVKVYDGNDSHSHVIGQYCSFHNNEELRSFTNQMLVVFTSDARHQEQGFAANYEFLPKTGTNIRSPVTNTSGGTVQPPVTCGSIISSLDAKNGTIESPNYPRAYPPDLSCRFTFQGVGRERIQLKFVHMDLYYPGGQASTPVDCTGSDSITVYVSISGEMVTLNKYCGAKLPPMLMSSSHTMTVEFRSYHSSSSVTGFLAYFEFVTNFGITTGVQDSRGTCIFNYQSHRERKGHFMSPNYPGLYPRNTECHYLFYGQEKERVDITFLFFEVDGITPRCEEHTNSDYVSFSNFAETEDRKLSRKCSSRPLQGENIESDSSFFRVTFKSNNVFDAHGFQALYQFRKDSDRERPKVDSQHNGGNNNGGGGGNGGDSSRSAGGSPVLQTNLLALLTLTLLLTSHLSPCPWLPSVTLTS